MITREIATANYPAKPLGEVATFLDSKRRPVKASERVEGNYPYYGANGQQGTIDGFIFDEPLILLAEDGGHFDTPDRGVAYQVEGKCWVNNHAHVLKPANEHLDITYLRRVLENYDIRPFINGSTRSKLTKAQASRIPIPLPPLEEQTRIAAILDQADALRRLRTRALDRLNTLGQATFHEMFGSEHVGKGAKVKLGDICDVRDGTHDSPKYLEDGHPLLTSKNFSSGKLTFDGAKNISHDDFVKINKRSKVDVGDIIMPMIGTIGSPVIVESEPNFAIKNVALIKFASAQISADFVHALLSGPFLENIVRTQGRGGTQKFVSLGNLRSIEFAMPSEADQIAFSAFRKQLASQRSGLEKARNFAEQLFASLQHRAFRGEL